MAVIEQDVEISEEMRQCYAKAAAIIRDRGWWQGHMIGPGGAVCLYGAIVQADGNYSKCGQACRYLRLHLGQHIPEWNDAPERTEEEVLALLDELSCA